MPTKTGQPTKTEKQAMREQFNKRLAVMKKVDQETGAKALSEIVGRWTYSDIARATGVTVASISYVFTLQRWPRLPLGVKIARFLGITAEELTIALAVGRKRQARNEADAKRRRAEARKAKKQAAA